MPELALARSDNDYTLSSGRSPTPNLRRARRPNKAKYGWRIFVACLTQRNLAIAALSAISIGFLVNALALQNVRHPAPLFMPPQPLVENMSTAKPGDVPMPLPRPVELGLVQPVLTPAPAKSIALARTVPARAAGSPDQIALLLRPHVAGAKPETTKPESAKLDPIKAELAKEQPNKSVLSAQKALVKLGFVLKPDGVFGGTTRQAIERFERDKGMPVKGELSPKIVRLLATESGISGE